MHVLQEEEKANFAKVTVPKWLGYFEALLKSNGGKFFVGDGVCISCSLMVYLMIFSF
jgi:hypothetical protein